MTTNPQISSFHAWVSEVLIDIPDEVIAFAFNIYEEETEYCVDIIGTDSFSGESDEWANHEIWNSGPLMFIIPKDNSCDWEDIHDFVADAIEEILSMDDDISECLTDSECVAVGFIDGDLENIWQS